MKKYLLVVLTFLMSLQVNAQDLRKLNMRLSKIVGNPEMRDKHVNLLVKGNINLIRSFVENHNGIIRYYYGDIAAVKIPGNAIINLAGSDFVSRMEAPGGNYLPMNDSMRSESRINEVHAGLAPLPQGYDGTGVVVGIIDTGVDFTHPDLQDSSGNTRIKYLWDQTKPNAPNTPAPYGYGQEWDNADIDAGTAVHNDWQWYGHGTHVTGIAAGDGSAINKNKGGAPNADIIVVAFDFNNSTDPTYADAVDYIFNRADLLGKPCVINASLGDYYGSHDGLDLQSQLINNLLNQQDGRAMVAAAGNAGGIPFHLGYNVNTDTSFTWLTHNTVYPSLYFQVWADISQFNNVDFSIGADVDATQPSYRGRISFRDMTYHLGQFRTDTLFSVSGNRLAIIQSFGSTQAGSYLLEFNLIPDSATYKWRWMTTGSGSFDMWKFHDGTLSPGFVYNNLPTSAQVPEIVYYKLPDITSTIVSGFQCLDNVITVGNYGNRESYVDVNGNTYTDPNVISGELAGNSSAGPTRDGRIKPDIAAPGGLMLSCGQLSLLQVWVTQPTNAPKVAEGGFHFRDGGTSSASPVVAGIAALYLEQNPTATAMDVRNAIVNCAITDTFTGTSLPDNQWGYGKADAFNTLTNCSLSSSVELLDNNNLIVYPNPVVQGNNIILDFKNHEFNSAVNISIYNALGQRVFYKEIEKQDLKGNKFNIPTQKTSTGIYTVRVMSPESGNSSVKISII
jgi:subtilisin family serine protease